MSLEETAPLGAIKKPHLVRRLYDWTLAWADKPGGERALFVLALAEASVFPVPPDVLLLALCTGAPKRSFRFASVCAAGSILGGMLGYLIGFTIWQSVKGLFIPFLFSLETFETVQRYYEGNAFLAILTAAFTPIPFKVFTIAAGVFQVSFVAMVAAAMIGRSARFFLVAGIIFTFGAQVKVLIEKYFDWFAWGLLLLGVGGFVAVKYLR